MRRESRRFRLTAVQSRHLSELTRRRFLKLASAAALSGVIPACLRDNSTLPSDPIAKGELHYATLVDVARKIKSREISPLDLVQSMLSRIEAVDSSLKSYATVTPERALAAAEKVEQEIASGNYRGPMHGIPVAVKDLCYTKGIRTMGGLAVFRDFRPDYDGTAVSRLKSAGAILLGKLNLTEGAMAGYHRDFDVPVNPWDPTYWSGASSSGSGVAVAAGLCFAALGTDTGGSIRFPSMANGIVGLKPTYGRVSRYGVHPLGETLDHVGPMTRSVTDAAIVLEAIAGHDINDPTSLKDSVPDMLEDLNSGVAGMRIGYDRAFASEGLNAGLVTAIEDALSVLEYLGASIVDVKVPVDPATIGDTWFAICSREAFNAHAKTFPSRADEYGMHFREFLEIGASITDDQYAAATEVRNAFNEQFNSVLGSTDTVICPAGGFTLPLPPEIMYGSTADLQPLFEGVQMHFTIPADFSGTPALTLPCGFAENGIPYAMQLLGPQLSEARLCRIGHAFEKATDWHDRHPTV